MVPIIFFGGGLVVAVIFHKLLWTYDDPGLAAFGWWRGGGPRASRLRTWLLIANVAWIGSLLLAVYLSVPG